MNFQNGYHRLFMKEAIYNKPYGISSQLANQMLVTFAFTRNPFSRLVSCYHSKYQKWVFHKPKQFAKFVIQSISDASATDGHYRPQYTQCPFCEFEFDLVGRIEDMESHTAFLAELLDLQVTVLHVF